MNFKNIIKLLCFLLLFAYSTITSQTVSKIEIGNYKLEVNIKGTGSPSVVFESGLGDDYTIWKTVQDSVSNFTSTLSYSRAGYGNSDEGGYPRTMERIIDEFHLLLNKSGFQPPYILVGHSLGGLAIRLYASKYPEEIAGLVFVDPSYEDQGIIYSEEMPEWSKNVVKRISERYKNASKTIQSEFGEFKKFVNDKNKVLLHLPDIPIYILTNNKSDGSEITGKRLKIWRQMHENLFNQVSDAVHLVTTKSGHYIQSSEPGLVIDAITYIYGRVVK